MRTKVISIRLTEDEYECLDEIAISRRMTIADMVRELIRQGTPGKELIDGLRQIKEGVQELRDMALDRGLRNTIRYAHFLSAIENNTSSSELKIDGIIMRRDEQRRNFHEQWVPQD
jgi:hypothetical protein